MDLIYTDKSGKDLGVVSNYKLDMAYGYDENNFELTIPIDNHCIQEDYMLYIDGTEYGGVVDSISPNAPSNIVTYSGRTWHGLLESKVIEPDEGSATLTFDDVEVHEALKRLLVRLNLQDRFYVIDESTEDTIDGYEIRYATGYLGICAMLKSVNRKLMMKWNAEINMMMLYTEIISNYSIDEEFDNSQVAFSLKKNYNVCNHLICLGTGEGNERKVIHLFTDEDGNVQPFSKYNLALQDSDYILDKRNQVLFDNDEVCKIYDYPSASTRDNFTLVPNEPSDWKDNYFNYYKFTENGYVQVEKNLEDVYELQNVKPNDWDVGLSYTKYYEMQFDEQGKPQTDDEGNYIYESVKGVEGYYYTTYEPEGWENNFKEYFEYDSSKGENVQAKPAKKTNRVIVTTKPADWKTNYSNYFIKFQTGTGIEWRNVEGVRKQKYTLMTNRPSDWSKNWKDYYCIYDVGKGSSYKYTKCGDVQLYKNKAPKFRKDTFFRKDTYEVAPDFSKDTIYRIWEDEIPPTWVPNKYLYRRDDGIPAWSEEKYYTFVEDVDVGVVFHSILCYNKVEDNYAELVAGGIEKLKEYHSSDEISINLELTGKNYDIGDIIGATDEITRITVSQPISKKIVTIENDIENIEYEVKNNV